MKTFNKITIIDRGFPIYQSEYLNWVVAFSTLPNKTKKAITSLYQEIIALIANPDDIILDNIRIFLDEKEFTIENIKDLDFANVLEKVKSHDPITVKKVATNFNAPVLSQSEESAPNQSLLEHLKSLAARPDSQFFYHTVMISAQELFTSVFVNGVPHYEIALPYLPYLRYLDLSKIPFAHIDLRGIDLSYTNITSIDFSSLFNNSIENTNLEGISLPNHELRNIAADGANLTGTYLIIDLDSTSIEGTILDKSNILISQNRILQNTRTRKPINIFLHF